MESQRDQQNTDYGKFYRANILVYSTAKIKYAREKKEKAE